MIKRLAIIPARSGSKRIKNKNTKLFLGKPLIEYSLDACIKSKLFNEIFVSSDKKAILKIAKKKKIIINNLRPKKLSNDKVPLISVIKHVVKMFQNKGQNFDEIWLIYATNPMINKLILKKCASVFTKKKNKKNKDKALMTVTEYNYPIQWAQKIDKYGILKPLFNKTQNIISQELVKYYCDAGMLAIYKPNSLNNPKRIKYLPFVINKYKSVDIDNLDDFNFAVKLKKYG